MERLTREETIIVGGEEKVACNYENNDCNDSCMYGRCKWQGKANMLLKEYENTGLSPTEIRDLKEPIMKLQEHFGDAITVAQVIDFFVDFYIAQGDSERVEEAVLLTNEEVARYRELKERDTEYFCKTSIFDHESVVCKCGNDIEKDSGFNFCPYCGQRIKWEE